ncbi:glycosyl transferase family 2 [Breznakibacter xylanolyticus]|uniref:Glycosyl transferase family 2 n=1 Tax=Breznakibacter xylanolyticus TaxID=990 RepID=A0A2W7NHZ1_9BACT|nr:glycosyltransferase [Breznakibacter xylanolyticus]PZX19470.1 glycosyl transferase family 2 [Breznakibacter xylanolyticus]
MIYAPVALFVYNRPQHVSRTIEALQQSEGANDTILYVFSDGPKSGESEVLIDEVRHICHHLSGFKQVIVNERSSNMGLAANIIDGVTQVVREHGRVIVLEDDLQVQSGFLRYMNAALDSYCNHSVLSVCAYTPPISIPDDYSYSTYLTRRIGSWGWGTWRDVWERVDWGVPSFEEFITDKHRRCLFNSSGNDLSVMLLKQQQGIIRSWAVRFAYWGFISGLDTVYPVKSLIANHGVDGSGTHMKKSQKYVSSMTDFIDVDRFCPPGYCDMRIVESFRKFYNTSLFRKVINWFKVNRYIYLNR